MAVTTYTNGGTANQPFGSGSGIKFIDNFVTTSFPTQGPVDPWTGVSLYLVSSVKMYMGGTSGTASAARLGLWNSATSVYDYASVTINGVTATVSSATVLETATLNSVIQSGKSYFAGGWATATLASKRNTSTGSFSSYLGNATSGTVGTTYNPGNLYFQVLYYYLPNAPTSVTVTSKTQTSATISWTAPSDDGGTPVTGYSVDYSADGGTNWSSWTYGSYSASPATTATITGLKPGGTYIFRVAAKNGVVPGFGFNGTNGTAGTYSDSSGTWNYDGYSSGPYSTSSSSTQLPGGRFNGSVWQPVSPLICVKGSQTSSGLFQGVYTYTVEMTLPSVTGIAPGDYVIIRNATNSAFNISTIYSGTVQSITGNTVFYSGNTFNTSVETSSASATVEVWRSAAVKRYNGSTWVTVL